MIISGAAGIVSQVHLSHPSHVNSTISSEGSSLVVYICIKHIVLRTADGSNSHDG